MGLPDNTPHRRGVSAKGEHVRPPHSRSGSLLPPGVRRSRPTVRRLVLAAALVGALTASAMGTASALPGRAPTAAPGVAIAADPTLSADGRFGPRVLVFDPSMPTSEIQAAADAISAAQVDDEMGTNRWSLLFRPGTYGTDERAAADQGRLLHRGRGAGRGAR